jgi:hypothetical protein
MINKRIVFFFFLLLILGSVSANAVDITDTIKLNPIFKKKKPYPIQPLVLKTSITGILAGGGLLLFTSEYRLTAEITTGRKQSDQVSIGLLSKNVLWKAIESAANVPANDVLKVNGWRIQYAHKFYLVNRKHHSPYGFYVGPHVSYTNAKLSFGLNRFYNQTYYDIRHFNANVIFGVQVGKIGKLTMDVSGGIGYKSNTIFYHYNSYTSSPYDTSDFGLLYNNHLHLMFDFSLGFSF